MILHTITLEYVKRFPESERSRKWRKKRVHIYTEGRGFWLPQAAGYTNEKSKAWTLLFETAKAHTASLNPKENKIEFHLVDEPGNEIFNTGR